MKKALQLSVFLILLVSISNSAIAQPCFSGGTGVDGAYTASSNTSIAGGTYNFTTFTIDAGVTVNVTGTQPLIINCTGNVNIDGALTANGGNGVDGVTYVSGGIGGIGVAGGANGGAGTYASGTGPLNGVSGSGPGAGNQGGGWSGGGGAGYALVGASSGGVGGIGGPVYGDINISGLESGSGGGGGSGGYECGAGGGGAGGGVIVINSSATITIGATGMLAANGGNGGSDGTGNCGGGGGGSGGAIFLACPTITNNGAINCLGGNGGSSNVPGNPYYGGGGSGSVGRIRVDHNGSLLGSGTSTPAIGSSNTLNSPPIFVPVSFPNDSVCDGYPITLYGDGDAASYTWSGGVIDSSIFVPAGSQTYTVTASSAGGCTSTASISITVSPSPTTGFLASPNDTVCAGTMVTLSGTGASDYSWSGGINNGTPFNTTPATSGTYTVTGTSLAGCSSSATIYLEVIQLPYVSISGSIYSCPDNPTILTGNGGLSNQWYLNGVAISGATGISYSATQPGHYNLIKTDSFGCADSASSGIDLIAAPSPNVNLGADIVQPNPPALLDAGAGFNSYYWNTTESTQSISVNTGGQYMVTVSNTYGCTDKDTIQVTFTAGIYNTNGTEVIIQVYPNPSSGVLYLNIQNLDATSVTISLLDLTGKIIYNQPNNIVGNNFSKMLDLNELSNGVYMLQINADGKISQHRFIISK